MSEKTDAGKKSVTTSAFLNKLFKTKNISRFLSDSSNIPQLPSLSEYISGLCSERGLTPGQVIKHANIDVSFGHQIFKGQRHPSRDKVLQLAYGFDCDLAGAQELLKYARMSPLHPKVKRDAAIMYCLHNGVSQMDTQLVLHKLNLPPLGGEK